MIKFFFLILLTIGFSSKAHSQYCAGLDFNYKVFRDGGVMNNPSLGLAFCLHNDEGNAFWYSGFTIGFPKSYESTVYATAYDFFNPTQAIPVSMTNKFTNLYFDLGYGFILNGDYEDGGPLLFGGVTAIVSRSKTTFGSYDKSNYYLNDDNGNFKQMNGGYGLKLGFGYLWRTGGIGLTPYVDVSVPIIEVDGDLPMFFGIGIRAAYFGD